MHELDSVNEMSAQPTSELGQRLLAAGFRPLPEVDVQGTLIGARLWRVRAGYVEYLALQRNGLAYAVRAKASFDYRHPAEHGPVVEHRFGYAANALDWLLLTADTSANELCRAYLPPSWPGPQDESGDMDGVR